MYSECHLRENDGDGTLGHQDLSEEVYKVNQRGPRTEPCGS